MDSPSLVRPKEQAVARETSGVGELPQLELRLRHILRVGIHEGSVLGFFAPMVIESLPSDARVRTITRGSLATSASWISVCTLRVRATETEGCVSHLTANAAINSRQ